MDQCTPTLFWNSVLLHNFGTVYSYIILEQCTPTLFQNRVLSRTLFWNSVLLHYFGTVYSVVRYLKPWCSPMLFWNTLKVVLFAPTIKSKLFFGLVLIIFYSPFKFKSVKSKLMFYISTNCRYVQYSVHGNKIETTCKTAKAN